MAENPETGSEEYNSSRKMVELLRKYGIQVEYPFAGLDTAFKGIINPEKESRMVLFLTIVHQNCDYNKDNL